MVENIGPEIMLSPIEPDDGDPFGFQLKKSNGLFDDVIITEVPHLALIGLEDFARIGAMRQTASSKAKAKGYSLHPFRGKWQCPRCNGSNNLLINAEMHWLRCSGAVARGVTKEQATCDAPAIDLSPAENLFFQALETFAPGREANFAATARERYDEVVKEAESQRSQAAARADHLRKEIQGISRELRKEQENQHIRASLQADADKLGAELDQLNDTLQDMRSIPDDIDPKESLLDLHNMIDKIKQETPFGFGINVEALEFRSRLHDVLLGITMVEKGDDVYDVEFHLDVAKAMGAKGSKVEIVRFADQNLRAGRFAQRRKYAGFERKWVAGEYRISDRAWKKRPSLPIAEEVFGVDLRWMVDTMIMTAETGLGTQGVVKVAGKQVPHHIVQNYRASAECAGLRLWLQEVRPRKHEYQKMKPDPRAPTLRQRMESTGCHPLLDLDRVHPDSLPSPLTDAEFKGLIAELDELTPGFYASMRARVDEMLETIRANHHQTWGGKRGFYEWYHGQVRRGTFLKIVNFLRSLEGKEPCASLPDVPKGYISKTRTNRP